jgi:hypothetical protein
MVSLEKQGGNSNGIHGQSGVGVLLGITDINT